MILLNKYPFKSVRESVQIILFCFVSGFIASCDTSSPCWDEIVFPDPLASPYVLPFPVGTSSELFQAYCNKKGHRGRLAYDFKLATGDPITASRAGKVVVAIQKYRDDDHTPGNNNRVAIRHADSTIAWYAHLQQNSVAVQVGAIIQPGDTLGLCGLSGRSGRVPHLHFEVFKTDLYDYADAIPVSFSNLSGELDARGMLIPGETYLARP